MGSSVSGSRRADRLLSLTWRNCDARGQVANTQTLRMQTTARQLVTNLTTASQNTTTTTKSKEQILTQSSGAMIAVIVIGIIIILAILLFILKTYNRRTHVSRVLGGGSKPRKKSSSTTVQTSLPMGQLGANSISGSFAPSRSATENGFRLPRAEYSSQDQGNGEQYSTASGSTVVTIHGPPSIENT
ncbi:hypothetical protein AGOR_G00102720 [Albula goreensis]|uniref:Noncompact myelin-associated protein n=1 Tax=Albula goreensis TaxID=1534307 RepID=A0A8T3DE50_9TELE|nr:hypothetical protein AGOR_G00102720 [Albula goreensis]